MSSRSVRIVKWCVKAGLFGGTVYLVTANGLWGDNAQNTSFKALQDFRLTADKALGDDYISPVTKNIPEMKLTEKWNSGVATTLNYAANMPDNVVSVCTNGLQYVSNKFK